MKRRNFLNARRLGRGRRRVLVRRPRGGRAPGGRAEHRCDGDLTWNKAPCRYCGTGCGVEVGVKDGRVVGRPRRRGEPGQPRAAVRQGLPPAGACCTARTGSTHPMLRHRTAGWKRISWDEALDLIATKYREALDATRSRDRWPCYGSGQWTVFDGYAASKWVRAGIEQQQPRAQRAPLHGHRP